MFVFCCLGRGACSFFCCLGGWRVFVLLFGPGVVFFFAVWAGGVFFFFLLFGPGGVFFLLWAEACFFFAVWAGGVFFLLLFGRVTGVHSLTGLPGSSLRDPTTKKTKQQKKNTGSLHSVPKREQHEIRQPSHNP